MIDNEIRIYKMGCPRLFLTVYGDWVTVISSQAYRDQLLPFKPVDEEMAEYAAYDIECEDTVALFEAYKEFRGRLQLRSHVTMRFVSEDKTTRCNFTSGDGYGSDVPFVDVEFVKPTNKVIDAVKEAIRVLTSGVS